MSMLSASVQHAFEQIVGRERFSLTDADRQQHARDQSSHSPCLPDAVIWPTSTAEVSAIVRCAGQHGLPVVGWGAGSSLEGNPMPVRGGLVVDFAQMNQIVTIHEQDFQVTVQPGVLYKDMNKVLARHGLFFAPDPGANASIGGMIANNAAGIRTVKYGATRDNVLALEVVLASGEVIRTGSRSVKQSAGYDLTRLFTGSEGTLGLITEATLKLAPLPEHFSAVTAAFPSVEVAAEVVFNIIGAGLEPSALELLDKTSIQVLCAGSDFDFPLTATLFMEFCGASEASLTAELVLVEEICCDYDVMQYQAGMGVEARNQLWAARHHLFEIFVRHYPQHDWLLTDVAVPISQYPALVARAAQLVESLELESGFIGHAGDGNLHTTTFFPAGDDEARRRAATLNDQLVAEAIALGGTCTGEHGVGMGKQKYMVQEHGEAAIGLMRQIKTLLDPHNLLNPGKVLGL